MPPWQSERLLELIAKHGRKWEVLAAEMGGDFTAKQVGRRQREGGGREPALYVAACFGVCVLFILSRP